MKKIIVSLLICVCLLPTFAFAETTGETKGLSAGWNVLLDGKALSLNQNLQIENDRAMVSGKALCEALGVDCDYASGVLKVLNGKIIFTAGSNICLLNGNKVALEVTPKEIHGELFIPVRFLAESLGYKVDFRQEMSADGKSVFASVVLINPSKAKLQLFIPEDKNLQNQILLVTSAVAGMDVGMTVVKTDYYFDIADLMAATGQPVLIYGNQDLSFSNGSFHDLTTYIKTISPETMTFIEENEDVREAISDEKGAIVAFPIQYNDSLDWFYVPDTIENVEEAVQYLDAYSKVTEALTSY